MELSFLQFLAGLALGAISVYVKDAISKNSMEGRLKVIESEKELYNQTFKSHDLRITNNREEYLAQKEKVINLEGQFSKFIDMHREEMKDIQSTLRENTSTIASLDSTLKSLTGWLKRIDEQMSQK